MRCVHSIAVTIGSCARFSRKQPPYVLTSLEIEINFELIVMDARAFVRLSQSFECFKTADHLKEVNESLCPLMRLAS